MSPGARAWGGRVVGAWALAAVILLPGPAPARADLARDLYLAVPYRSQYDATPYASGNCGPAALAMVISAAIGRTIPTTEIRDQANALQGTTGIFDSGTTLEVLSAIGRRHGLIPLGLRAGNGYHQWTPAEVRAELAAGRPIIPQIHYASLPGHERGDRTIDHYIVLVGTRGDDFIYQDPAFVGANGRDLVISTARLRAAWGAGSYGFAGVAFAAEGALPGVGLPPAAIPATLRSDPPPRQHVPGWLTRPGLSLKVEDPTDG